jgi:hypothetical protein
LSGLASQRRFMSFLLSSCISCLRLQPYSTPVMRNGYRNNADEKNCSAPRPHFPHPKIREPGESFSFKLTARLRL